MSGRRERIVFVASNPSVDRLYEVARLADGTIHRPSSVVVRPGGKGLNAARAAAALGAQVTAIAVLAGHSGNWIVDELRGSAVEVVSIHSSGETRSCLSILDLAAGGLTEVYEPGLPIDLDAWDGLEAAVGRECEREDVGALTLSGSLPVGAPTVGYARIARIARAMNVPVLADVYGPALHAVLRERPAVVKVNASEAAEAAGLAGTDAAAASRAAAWIVSHGAEAVVVTLGTAGALVVSPEGELLLDPPTRIGRYPVGSGDAFLGGVATAYVQGATITEAARLGMAAATANALVPGAGDLDMTALDGLPFIGT